MTYLSDNYLYMNILHDIEAERIEVLDSRFYTNDKVSFYPGSTTILDVYPKGAWYEEWLKNNGNDSEHIRDRAAESGSKVHKATELLDAGVELAWTADNYTLTEWQMILNYKDFITKVKPEIIASEKVMCSNRLGFGGTLDRIMEFAGKRWLLDIKTSNQVSETFPLQAASYAMLWNEMHLKLRVTGICVLWLKSKIRTDKIDEKKMVWQGRPGANTVGWQIVTFDETIEELFEDFQHVQAIWKRKNPNFRPLNQIFPDRVRL